MTRIAREKKKKSVLLSECSTSHSSRRLWSIDESRDRLDRELSARTPRAEPAVGVAAAQGRVNARAVTVASLVSGNVAVRYDEASAVVGAGALVLAPASRLVAGTAAGSSPAGNVVAAALADHHHNHHHHHHNNNNNSHHHHSNQYQLQQQQQQQQHNLHHGMETTQAEQLQPSALGLVKSEAPDTPSPSPAATVQTQVTVSAVTSGGTTTTVTRPPGNGSGLFAGIAPSSNKRPRTDDWLAPESPQGPLPQQHIYLSPQQQQQQQQQSVQQQHQQQQQPPMAHSTPVTQQQQQQQQQSVIGSQPPSNNGYASPMSSGSYDPYSPNGKIGKFGCIYLNFFVIIGIGDYLKCKHYISLRKQF